MGTVSLVGDVMFRQPFARSADATTPGFHAAVAAMRESDLVVANLEMCLSRRGVPVPKHTTLRQDPDLLRDVQAMGVHAVTLANNHMYDYGPDALSTPSRRAARRASHTAARARISRPRSRPPASVPARCRSRCSTSRRPFPSNPPRGPASPASRRLRSRSRSSLTQTSWPSSRAPSRSCTPRPCSATKRPCVSASRRCAQAATP